MKKLSKTSLIVVGAVVVVAAAGSWYFVTDKSEVEPTTQPSEVTEVIEVIEAIEVEAETIAQSEPKTDDLKDDKPDLQ